MSNNWLRNEGLELTLSNDRLKNEGLEPMLSNDWLKNEGLETTLSNDWLKSEGRHQHCQFIVSFSNDRRPALADSWGVLGNTHYRLIAGMF